MNITLDEPTKDKMGSFLNAEESDQDQCFDSESSQSEQSDEEQNERLNMTVDDSNQVEDPYDLADMKVCEEFQSTEDFALWVEHI